MKVFQYIHRPNTTELGLGNTHETYMLVKSEHDLSSIFPPGVEINVKDASSGKVYVVKSANGREFRINQMGELYRDYSVRPGDEIVITSVLVGDSYQTFVSVNKFNRVMISVSGNGAEINSEERLTNYSSGVREYIVPIFDRGQRNELHIKYLDSKYKRSDSPNKTDYYSVYISNSPLSNGAYYLTLMEKSVLETLPKSSFNVVDVNPDFLGKINHTCSITNNIAEHSIQYNSYLPAIKTKPFLILGGFSGTGKSQKVKELAFMTCPNDDEMRRELGSTDNTPGNYCLVSVRPNWHDSSDLPGYYSSINDKYVVTDFVRFVVKAMQHRDIPFFVCLDEMNLAPVEEYFAEFLSVLESRKKVGDTIKTDVLVSNEWFAKDYGNNYDIFSELGLKKVSKTVGTRELNVMGARVQSVPVTEESYVKQDVVDRLKQEGLTLPPNLIVIGTVNMDDTTNSFSRKVIDRAMTFETKIDVFGEDYYNSADMLTYGDCKTGDWKWILPDEVRANEALANQPDLLNEEEKKQVTDFVNDVNDCLKGSPFQISYRILNETILYYRSMKIVEKNIADLNTVFDNILMRKVLPRIEGDYDKTYVPLKNLMGKALSKGWKESEEKISFMIGRFSSADQSGFTSFWN